MRVQSWAIKKIKKIFKDFMSSYIQFPAFNKFKKCLQNCPTSALMYASVHAMRKNEKIVKIKKEEIKERLLVSPTIFKNHMIALARNELIEFQEKEKSFVIIFSKQNCIQRWVVVIFLTEMTRCNFIIIYDIVTKKRAGIISSGSLDLVRLCYSHTKYIEHVPNILAQPLDYYQSFRGLYV